MSRVGVFFREEWNMDENTNIVEEILHDLFSSMEALETQNTAILQFLKDKGIATDEELASHLEQAGNASSVRWRGVRVRADYLFASAIKAAEQAAEKESPKRLSKNRKQPQNNRVKRKPLKARSTLLRATNLRTIMLRTLNPRTINLRTINPRRTKPAPE
jgi:hypothetical protein